ncbi:DUF4030 domain-containing protein [Bacillus sp. FJAT-45350]|uniref:DUF4030 domain-containing protein n=1 Tax=Bacillus sp. FJAT-45350 TaxID=2011014 RepID=UPI000BB70C76|nr:DUF4030 domain-containing protein [Bacillus sp. FJAT-45350]
MKKGLVGIGFVVLVGIIVGSGLLFNNSEEPVASAQNEELDMSEVNKELATLTMNVMQSLNSNYEGIGDILIDYQESLTIQTSLDSEDSHSKQIAKDIQKSVEEVLDSEELDFISIDSYKIYVESKDGEILN